MNYNYIKTNIRQVDFLDRLGYYALLAIGTIVIPFLTSGLILPLTTSGKDKVIGYTILFGVLITNILFSHLFIKLTPWTNFILGGLIGLILCGLLSLLSIVIVTMDEFEMVSCIIAITVITWESTYHLLRGRAKN
jgi:hypothetical protein